MSSILSSFKFISAKRNAAIDPIQFRREKLSKMLDEQITIATANLNNTTYKASRKKKIRDEDGNIQIVEVQKNTRTWWFTNDNKVALTVRYGNRAIEFGKGKNAIEISDAKHLLTTLEKIKQAVHEGQLDEQLTVASNNVRARFKK